MVKNLWSSYPPPPPPPNYYSILPISKFCCIFLNVIKKLDILLELVTFGILFVLYGRSITVEFILLIVYYLKLIMLFVAICVKCQLCVEIKLNSSCKKFA